MKITTRKTYGLYVAISTLALNQCAVTAPAAEIRKTNSGDLELGSSWLGGVAPNDTDVAVWDNLISGTYFYTIQTNISWEGMAIRDVLFPGAPIQFNIQGTGLNPFNTLTLGASGIDLSASTEDVVLAATYEGRLELATNQTWTVGPLFRRLTMACTNDGPGSLTKTGPGTLQLDYFGSGYPSDDSHINNSARLTLGGGILELFGGTHTEIVGSAAIAPGASRLQRIGGSSTLVLNAISRVVGGTMDFGPGMFPFVQTSTANDSSAGGGILGGWATCGPEWAQVSSGFGNRDIVAFPSSGYSEDFLPSNNVNLTNSVTLTNTTAVSINSLRLAPGFSPEVVLTVGTSGGYPLTVLSGGIMSIAAQAAIQSASGARSLRGPAGGDLIFHVFGTLTNKIVIANNAGSGLTKSGGGMLILDPPGINSYTGPTRINEGTLMTGSLPGRRYLSSNLFIDGGFNWGPPPFGPLGVAALLHGPTNDHLNGVSIVVNGGMLHMNGQVDACNTLAMSNNAVLTGFAPGSYLTVTNRGSNAVLITSGTVDAVLNDWGGLTKSGPGTVVVQRDSWVYGPTVFDSGTLWVGGGGSNSYSASTTMTLTSLALGNGTNTAKIILGNANGPGSIIVTSLLARAGSTIAGPSGSFSGGALVLNFAYDTNFDVGLLESGQNGEGSVGLTKTGAGVLTLTGLAGYYGSTTISNSKAILGNAGALAPWSGLMLTNGTLDLNGFSSSVGGLIGNGLITNSGGPLTLTVNNSGWGFSGNLADGNSQVSLRIASYGSQGIEGANTFTGDTIVDPNGHLYVSGSTRSAMTTVYGYLGLGDSALIGNGTGGITLAGGNLGLGDRTSPVSNPIYVTANSTIFGWGPTGMLAVNFSGPINVTGGALMFASAQSQNAQPLFEPRLTVGMTFNHPFVVSNDVSHYRPSRSMTRLCSFNPLGTTQIFNGPISGDGSFRRSAGSDTGGVTVLNATNTYAGETFVDNGTLLVNGVISGPSDGLVHTIARVTVTNRGILGGNGRIRGVVTVENGGVLAPGTSIGRLTIGPALSFAGGSTCLVELNKTARTNDLITGLDTLTYGGTLSLTNLAGALAVGDSFKLFNATNYTGAFTDIVPATPGPGMTWDTSSLGTNGTLWIAAAPRFESSVLEDTNFVMRGSGGISNGTYYILSSTNLNLPLTNWTRLMTNTFDANGNFIFTNVVSPTTAPQMFFMLHLP